MDAHHHCRTTDPICRGGHINTYVDLSGLAGNDLTLSPDGKSVTIRLSESKLDKPNLDQVRSSVFSQERRVFDRITDAMKPPQQAQFYKLAETKMTTAAEASDLRKQPPRTLRPC